MELIAQTVVVAVLVVASSVFAAWRLMPARTKLRLLDALNPSPSTLLGRRLTTLRKDVASQLASGCSSCSSAAVHVKKH